MTSTSKCLPLGDAWHAAGRLWPNQLLPCPDFLFTVPELAHGRWKKEQFDTVRAQLQLYVRDGMFSGQPKLNLFRDDKSTELRRKGTSTKQMWK